MITELHQQIESGEYFEKARNWYADKYLGVNTQVIASSIFLLIISTGAYFVVDSMMDKYFAVKYPVPIYVDDQVEFQSRIKSLAQGDESIDISVVRYLIAYYVINREEYRYNGLNQDIIQEKLSSIRSTSSRRVYTNYLNYMDPQKNPDSPILKYKLQIERTISIESIKFPEGVNRPNTAYVIFKAIEKNSTKESASYWLAEINFSLNSITNVLDYKSNLNFIVTAYKTMKKTDYKG
ncbi:MAG: VirB8/TrbF family protein [Candidatus Midichloria sp.]|uniref:Type IV secretion system protein VirB8 n=1 Tax=Hyalomma marginatum TaxID=34627 RepID=A0A8S4C4N0_9ACAR|nr:type IV secretion system protein VirB8 [Hyalomma marginatum]CAG7591145.1 type IV secretion system protein VirB8 [Hyalomma marginatum]